MAALTRRRGRATRHRRRRHASRRHERGRARPPGARRRSRAIALMSADVRMNARGFFEDIDVVKLDDALLDALGADWKSVALLDDVDWGGRVSHASARSDARRLLEARLARTGMFGFKDPRVPRLLPFWQRVFAADAASPMRT